MMLKMRTTGSGSLGTAGMATLLAALLSACGGGVGSGPEEAVLRRGAGAHPCGSRRDRADAAGRHRQWDGARRPVGRRRDRHNDNTRWGSGFSDDQWLTLDYGQAVVVTRVRIQWENAHATQYLLQVSDDNASWTTIKTVDNSQGGVEDWSGLNGQGRYLRMKGVKRSTQYGYSIFEIQAFTGVPVAPPVTPPDTPATPPTTSPTTPPGTPTTHRR